jgi:mannose/fructose/N-acetylgalactosamine-specific phosphotransferase system component IIC
MLETIINQAVDIFKGTFLTGDYIALVIAFGSVLVASLLMRRGTQIGSMTLLALVLFAVGGYLRGFFRTSPASGASEGDRAVAQLEQSWNAFMTMSASSLIAYFVAFMVLILVLFGARAVLGRG